MANLITRVSMHVVRQMRGGDLWISLTQWVLKVVEPPALQCYAVEDPPRNFNIHPITQTH